MATLQDAVKILLAILFAASIQLTSTVYAEESTSISSSEIQIYFDPTQPAYYLLEYKLRLLILLKDGVESCWEKINGTLKLVCMPLKNASVKVVYEEVKEYREALTNDEGVAEVSYRLLTYPIATFRVEVYSLEGYAETTIKTGTKIWILLAITSFSLMMGSLVVVVRRSLW